MFALFAANTEIVSGAYDSPARLKMAVLGIRDAEVPETVLIIVDAPYDIVARLKAVVLSMQHDQVRETSSVI